MVPCYDKNGILELVIYWYTVRLTVKMPHIPKPVRFILLCISLYIYSTDIWLWRMSQTPSKSIQKKSDSPAEYTSNIVKSQTYIKPHM